MVKEKRIWSDRIRTLNVPLLPNYIFFKTSTQNTNAVFDFPGVVRYVCSEGKPAVISEKEILYLQTIVNDDFKPVKTENFQLGDKVKIVNGPLKGAIGTLDKKLGKTRIVLIISGIQQAISIEVQACDIEKLVNWQ